MWADQGGMTELIQDRHDELRRLARRRRPRRSTSAIPARPVEDRAAPTRRATTPVGEPEIVLPEPAAAEASSGGR